MGRGEAQPGTQPRRCTERRQLETKQSRWRARGGNPTSGAPSSPGAQRPARQEWSKRPSSRSSCLRWEGEEGGERLPPPSESLPRRGGSGPGPGPPSSGLPRTLYSSRRLIFITAPKAESCLQKLRRRGPGPSRLSSLSLALPLPPGSPRVLSWAPIGTSRGRQEAAAAKHKKRVSLVPFSAPV